MTSPSDKEEQEFGKVNEQEVGDSFSRAADLIDTLMRETVGEDDEDGLFLPAINQLRYSGSCLAHVVGCPGMEQKELRDNLGVALFNSLLAETDAYDCAISYLLGKCEQFQGDYRLVCIRDTIPDYKEIRCELQEILESLEVNKDYRGTSPSSMKGLVECRKGAYLRLKVISQTFNNARVKLNKEVTALHRFCYTVLWTIIGVGIVVLGVIGKLLW